jgi:paraquat-inducible protein B
MSDPIDPAAAAAPVVLVTKRRYPSLVWLIPAVALLIGLWLVYQSLSNRGQTIEISFHSAEGLEPGKTRIRYKDVDIGVVKKIDLASDRSHVIVTALMAKPATDLLVSDTRFFVVKPRISGTSVSGLTTLLSGAYLSMDIGSSQEPAREFVGLEVPPSVTADSEGREFKLHGEQIGSLDIGSPVFFRRIKAGHVTSYALDKGGAGVTVMIFIDAPYDQYVDANSRFWHASGIDVSADANGLRVTTEAVAALLEGGLAFQDDTHADGPPSPVSAGASFTLFGDRARAMRAPDTTVRSYTMYFSESLRGLSPGAPVDLRGIVIGEVKSLGVEYANSGQTLRFPVEINIFPDRLRSRIRKGALPPAGGDAQEKGLIDRLLANGMRGQLKTGNLLTGQLFVALDFFPDAPKAAMDWSADPPVMPTINGGLAELQDTVGRIAKKIDKLPFDKLSGQLVTALDTLNKTLSDTERLVGRLDGEFVPQVTATLNEAKSTLAEARKVLDAESPVQQNVQQALKQVSRSARSIAALADLLEQHPESLVFGKKESGR